MVTKDNYMLDEVLFAKFLMGECTEDELRKVKRWMDESDEHASDLFQLEEIYHAGKINSAEQTLELDAAESRLFQRLEKDSRPAVRLWSVRRWMQYAAMLIGVFLLGGAMWFTGQQSEIWSEPLVAVSTGEEIKQLILSDGTKVWLNKHTRFRYPETFEEEGREVYLEGEGYFEVAKNPAKPFVVHSNAMKVKVLGTVFNLKTDEQRKSAVATLLQGEIEVKGNHDEGGIVLAPKQQAEKVLGTVFNLKTDEQRKSAVATLLQGEIEVKGNHDEGGIVLAPKQQAELDGINHRLVVRQLTTGIENWHNSSFVFQGADIFTIGRTLEQYYNINIVLSSDFNTKSTYSGVLIKSARIEDVLKSINHVIPVKYRIDGRTVYLSPQSSI